MTNKSTEEQIKTATSEVLAANVVVYRLIGLNKELALVCMSELARRRDAGEDFDYEKYIEDRMKLNLPEPLFKDVPFLFNLNRK